MNKVLENTYRSHHKDQRREGFSIIEKERGALFSQLIGTGKRVLDLGCRDGVLTSWFAQGNEVTGVDVDSHALASAASRLGIKTMQFDFNAEQWPIEPLTYDVVVAAEVIEHLYFPKKVLGRIKLCLKPGGMLVGSVPNAFSLKCRLRYLRANKRGTPMADPMHINQFGWGEFQRFLSAEFADVRLYPLGRRLYGLRDGAPALFAFGIGFCARVR